MSPEHPVYQKPWSGNSFTVVNPFFEFNKRWLLSFKNGNAPKGGSTATF